MATETGTYRALLIGNSFNVVDPASFPELLGPEYDLPKLREALTHRRLGLFRPEHVRLVFERRHNEILDAAEQFFVSAGRNDELLLYFSGHGHKDLSNNLYLCGLDTVREKAASSAVSYALINNMMDQCPARSLVVILDCCFSGAASKGPPVPDVEGERKFLLMSSGPDSTSLDAKRETDASAFTNVLTEALVCGRLESDADGFIGFEAVYRYVYEKLHPTGQIPYRRVAGPGDVRLARALPRTELKAPDAAPEPGGRPELLLSRTTVDVRAASPDEMPPPEVVEVSNSGAGTLDWTASSQASWITVEPEASRFLIRLTPTLGTSSGVVRVDERVTGSTQWVTVHLHVLPAAATPDLQASERELDFGLLRQGVASAQRTVQVRATSGGKPTVTVSASDPWIDVRHFGDLVVVGVDTVMTGEVSGYVLIQSPTGDIRIPVRANVEPGPVVAVDPVLLEFGVVDDANGIVASVRVSNLGEGELSWEHRSVGHFFTVERDEDRLHVRLLPRPGIHVGSIVMTSNGGVANVDVRADIRADGERAAPEHPEPPVGDPTLDDAAGTGREAGDGAGQPEPQSAPPTVGGPSVRVIRGNGELVFSPGRPIRIGRDTDADVITDNRWVSRRHAELRLVGSRWVLIDLDSTEGVYHTGSRVSRLPIDGTVTVWLGPAGKGERLVIVGPRRRRPRVSAPPSGQVRAHVGGRLRDFSPGAAPVTIGRDADCDISVDNPFVSRRHAELRWESGHWMFAAVAVGRTFRGGRPVQQADLEGHVTLCLGPLDRGEELVLVAGPSGEDVAAEPEADAPTASRSDWHRVLVWVAVILALILLVVLL